MPETDRDRAGGTDVDDRYDERYDDEHPDDEHPDDYADHREHERDDEEARPVHTDDVRAGRRYRPGRGGFDPEAAALAARAKYARRQRIVLVLLLTAVTTGALAALVATPLWWVHALVDLALVGFLVYLRKQVRIENEVRERRLARLSGGRDQRYDERWDDRQWEDGWNDPADDEDDRADRHELDPDWNDQRWDDEDWDGQGWSGQDWSGQDWAEGWDESEPGRAERPAAGSAHRDGERAPARREPHIPASANAVPLDIDDEDPDFDELDERLWQPYRRASGE